MYLYNYFLFQSFFVVLFRKAFITQSAHIPCREKPGIAFQLSFHFQLPVNTYLKRLQVKLKNLSACHIPEKPGLSFWLLDLACLSPRCQRYLETEPWNGRMEDLPLFFFMSHCFSNEFLKCLKEITATVILEHHRALQQQIYLTIYIYVKTLVINIE